jgi:ABC-2 type transport system ATP-binding protein
MHIEARGLGRRFGRKAALTDLTFAGRPGEIIAVIGNNGAGKTTLLQMLAGLIVPTAGRLEFDGAAPDRRDEKLRRRMAILPDFPPCFSDHTVLHHLAMVCRLYGVPAEGLETRAVALMEEIGVLELGRSTVASLSRGQIYKVVLVGFLLANPELWLLDEPMASGMDPQGLNVLQKHLRACAEEGATVFYTTQIPEIAEKFSDRIFVLQDGALIAQQSAEALLARTGTPTLAAALEALETRK